MLFLAGLVSHMTPVDAEDWLENRLTEAHRMLLENWSNVEPVAGALVERRQLDRDDLWDLIPLE
jgi:hypothetical protein